MSLVLATPAAVHATSGAIGSVLANLVMFPLDVVTVRMQVQRELHSDERQYRSVVDAIKRIRKSEGASTFFTGVADDSLATLIQSFLYFFAYDYMRNRRMRQKLRRHGRAPRTLAVQEELFYGTLAGIFCKLFTIPINNVVVLRQTEEGPPRSTRDCVEEIYGRKGILGFWSGYKASLILSVNPSLAYYFYQALSSRRRETAKQVFFRAAIAKSLATIITYPVILAKTRTQASLDRKGKSLAATIRSTIVNGGITGLYDGATAQLLKGFFTQGITMTTKESLTRLVLYIYLHLLKRPRSIG